MASKPIDPLDALRAAAPFARVPKAALERLAKHARTERFVRRTLLSPAGGRLDHLRWVRAGAVEVSLVSKDGRMSSLSPIGRGGWATWLGCFHEARMPHDLWAAAQSVCVAFPCREVRALADIYPGIYHEVIQEIGGRMRALMTWTLESNALDAERALARLVLALCRAGGGANDGPTYLDATQEQIAHLGFGSRQRVSRKLHALEARQLIALRYGRISVPSLRKLERFLAQ